MELDKQSLEKIKNYFVGKPEVAAVYLYGSFAKGRATEDSDVDLGVVFKKKEFGAFVSPEVVTAIELGDLIDRKVEVIDLELCRVDFAHRVIGEGKLICSQDETKRINFEEKVLRNYFSLKPALDEYYHYLSLIARKGELDVRYL